MKICIISSSFPLCPEDPSAAAGLFVRDFADAVAARDHSVTVLTQDKGYEDRVSVSGMEVHCYPWSGGARPLAELRPYRPRDVFAMISLLRQGARSLAALHERTHFDHVLAMWAVPAGWLARGLKRRAGVPYTVWCLGSDIWTYGRYPLLRGVVAKALRESDLCYADGRQLAEDAQQLGKRPVQFLPSSRKLDNAESQEVDAAGTTPRFLFVGRYARVKGIDVLLDAMARFVARQKRGFLYLFGGGPMAEAIAARAAADDVKEHVCVGGYADRETMVSYMEACDVVVIPSRMESIPLILSDALQMGKPVIVSDVGDMGSLLRETPAGLVVPPDDPDALCAAMEQMALRSPTDFARAVEELADRFDVQKTADRWLKAIA